MPSYAPHTPQDIEAMLAAIGVDSLEALFSHLPANTRLDRSLNLPPALDEGSLYAHLLELSQRNKAYLPPNQLMGAGLYAHYQPSFLDMIYSRSEYLTSYTPYQPEISQGTLQTLYEYQTMICELTGLDISNASSYDASTAAGDALGVLASFGRGGKVLVSELINPQIHAVLDTYNYGLHYTVDYLPASGGRLDPLAIEKAITPETRGVILQSPNRYGVIESPETIRAIADAVHAVGGVVVMVTDPLACALLIPPGEMGVDIAVGEAQAFGNTPNFGGPVCGFFACTEALMRKLPGRVVGLTTDTEGRKAYVLTLTAREQHIRREKATSNLCTAQALNALGAAAYMAFYGRTGLPALARRVAGLTHAAMQALSQVPGCCLPFNGEAHFQEFVLTMKDRTAGEINCRLCGHGFSSGIPLDDQRVLIAFNETHEQSTIDQLVRALDSFNQQPAPALETAEVA